MDLKQRFVLYSETGEHPTGIHFRPTPMAPTWVWAGCHRWSLVIVESALARLNDPKAVTLMRIQKTNTAYAVSTACLYHSRYLAFPDFVEIIDTAAQNHFMFETVDWYRNRHPKAGFLINMPYSETVRHTVENLAKAVLWIEALTFIEAEGYIARALPRAA